MKAVADLKTALLAYDRKHKAFLAQVERKDLTEALDLLEEYFGLVRQVPNMSLERERARVIEAWGASICKGNPECVAQFIAALDEVIALSEITGPPC